MIRKPIFWTLLDLVFLVAFNLVFFIVGGFAHTISVWISYAFIHISYILLLLTPVFSHKNKEKFILGMSISVISYIYFMMDLLCGILFIILLPEIFIVPLIVNIILLALYVIILMSVIMTNERTNENLAIHETEMEYIKNASSKLQYLLTIVDDKVLSKEIEKAYDIIRTSPAHSDISVKAIENEVLTTISTLNVSISFGKDDVYELISKVISLAIQRNITLKSLN